MKKRLMSMLLVLCMVFTLFPQTAFAEEASAAIGTSSVTEGAPLCENHKVHDTGCGYIEAKDAQPCGHLNEDGGYSCTPVKDSGDVSGNTATPGDAEEKYVCDHSDGCGYKEAVDGADCTHECELCKGAAPALLAAMPIALIEGTGYSYDPATTTLTISSNAGTTAWRGNNSIAKANVTTVVIESGVTAIGDCAFQDCIKLASVTFADGSQLKTIGMSAFESCTSLTSLTIPSGVTKIDNYAFYNCTSLASVTFEGATSPTTFGADVFTNTASDLKIYVPKDSVQNYKNKLFNYADKIEAKSTPTTKITKTLDLQSVTADVKCTDSNVGNKITGMTQHTHADSKPCWAWNNATTTLTLNNVDIEVSADKGIALPKVALTILFSGSNTVKADLSGIYHDQNSLTLTGESNSARLNISANSQSGIYFNNSLTVTEGIVNVTSESDSAIVSSSTNPSINLSGGTVTAKGPNGKRPFDVEPTLSNGMVHKAGTGTWNNTTGTACVYEKGAAATVTAVAVTPKAASVQKGTTQQFNATVTGTNNPAQTVTWAVTGGTKSGTTISTSGLLTVAADETATSLTVKATSTVDTNKSDTATVTVTTTPVVKYTVTVIGGTGSGEYEEGADVPVTANAAPAGQRFKEWTLTGIALADNTQTSFSFYMPAGAVSLTAVYEPIPAGTYTVTLDANGGSVSPTSLTVAAGSTATLPTPSRSGSYRFDGWFTAASNGTQYTNSTPINSNVTLYAHWTYTGGGSTGGDDGGSGGGGSTSPTGGTAGGVTTPGKTVIDNPVGAQGSENALTEAVKAALATGKTSQTVYTNFANYTALTKEGLKAINDAAAAAVKGKSVTLNTKVQLDNKVGSAVVSRITVDPAKLAAVMPEKLGLGIWFDQKKDAQVTAVRNKFEKAFDNSMVVVTFEQTTPLQASMELAAKPDMTGLNTKSLYFYSYNPETNLYYRIWSPGYWVDTKGYTHLTAPFGGSVIITDKPLTKK